MKAPVLQGVDAEIVALIKKDNLIAAIKRHRELYKTDLRTAKTAIEALRDKLRP